MPHLTMTRELANACAIDAGNGDVRFVLRPWTEEDYNRAVAKFNELWPYDEVHMPNGTVRLYPLGHVQRCIENARRIRGRKPLHVRRWLGVRRTLRYA